MLSGMKSTVLLLLTVVLTACQLPSAGIKNEARSYPATPVIDRQTMNTPAENLQPAPAPAQPADSETAELERCKAQLESLRRVAPDKYGRFNNAFRYIMSGAASYASVRSKTNLETQETIDALYKYRSKLICAQIDQAMMNSLSLHGALPQ